MADVASTLAQWSSTTNNNSPSGTTTIGTGLDDNLREIQGVIVRGLSHKGSDIASAATTDLGAVEGLFHDITGTTTITSFGTVRAGILKIIKFEGALTLTHNATSLILPGGANITTADGDIAIVISEGSGNWRCVSYVPATGRAVTAPVDASDTAKGVIEVAVQSEMEAASSTTLAVTPGRQHYHPGMAKAWVNFTGTGTVAVNASYNVTSVTDNGTGSYTVNWTTAFSSANYCVQVSDSFGRFHQVETLSTTGVTIKFFDSAGNASDVDRVHVVAYGDQ